MRRRRQQANVTDRNIFQFIGLLLVLLITVQAVLFYLPSVAPVLNTALRLEGKPLQSEELARYAGDIAAVPWACITLKLLGPISRPEIKIMVDGQEVADFLHNEVTIAVRQGSLISIRDLKPLKSAATVIVSKKTSNIAEPALNSKVSGTNDLMFGPVIIK